MVTTCHMSLPALATFGRGSGVEPYLFEVMQNLGPTACEDDQHATFRAMKPRAASCVCNTCMSVRINRQAQVFVCMYVSYGVTDSTCGSSRYTLENPHCCCDSRSEASSKGSLQYVAALVRRPLLAPAGKSSHLETHARKTTSKEPL